jgi:hypothetical protein
MFSRWWPRLTVVWPTSTQLTSSLGLNTPAENLGRHTNTVGAALRRYSVPLSSEEWWSEAPGTSLSEEEETLERSRWGCSWTHQLEEEELSDRPEAAVEKAVEVAASLCAERADQGNQTWRWTSVWSSSGAIRAAASGSPAVVGSHLEGSSESPPVAETEPASVAEAAS